MVSSYVRELARAARGTEYANYGWVITWDALDNEHIYVMGPSDIDPALQARLPIKGVEPALAEHPGVFAFQLYDDDGEFCGSGYWVGDADTTDSLPEEAFGPLTDFGEGGWGCTEIRYLQHGKWTTL